MSTLCESCVQAVFISLREKHVMSKFSDWLTHLAEGMAKPQTLTFFGLSNNSLFGCIDREGDVTARLTLKSSWTIYKGV
jgi:hypothetical protein